MTDPAPNDVKNWVALVTGGASGLGRACVEHFVNEGIRVVVLDLNIDNLSTIEGKHIDLFAGNVASEADVQVVAEHIREKYGRLDVILNSAGVAHREMTFDPAKGTLHSLEQFNRVLQVNTVGTFNVIRLLAPIMASNQPDWDGQRGVIINASSIFATDGVAGFAAYSASKAAVNGMTLPLAREFGPMGIRIVTISPGYCDTPMTQAGPEAMRQRFAAKLEQLSVFPRRMVRPQEFVHLVQTVIDNHSINAEIIRLDGGMRIS